MNVIITGASRGIGFELAKHFLDQGATVICLTRNTETLAALNHPKLKFISTDLNSQDSMNTAISFIKKEFSHIDYIIHNAGSIVNKTFESISVTELQNIYQVNVFAPFYLTQQLLSLMGKQSHKTHIVTISSMGGVQGTSKFPGLSAYSSSKAALAGLTECLSEELKDKNIAVNCLAIGAVQTDMLHEAFPGYQAPITPTQMANYIYQFTTTGHQFYNGKILPVSSSTP